jgi:glycosyltransferase involved in cell wall biosynthesis
MNNKSKKIKLAALISHPIQYFSPLYKEISKLDNIDFKVYFYSDIGTKSYLDKGFGKEIKFDIPLLEGYKYEFLDNISPFKNKDGFFKFINLGILKKLVNKEIDILWIHGWYSFTNILSVFTANFLNTPVMLRAEAYENEKNSRLKEFIKKIILKLFFQKINIFLSIGSISTEFYKSYGVSEDKIYLMPYTVNNQFFILKYDELKDKKYKLREKYNIPKDLPVILFSGKFINVKRPMDLLKAFEKLVNEVPSSLVFMGDGVLRKEMEDYTKRNNIKNVFFMGFRNQTELPEFYAMSDVFVLPSSFEPWGLVVNEAMCFNLPIIVSDKVGASLDLVKNDLNGYIYSSGDIKALHQKLKVLINDSNKRVDFGNQSERIISKWSYAECIECISKVLN